MKNKNIRNKEPYMLYYGFSLIIAILININIEYKDFMINHPNIDTSLRIAVLALTTFTMISLALNHKLKNKFDEESPLITASFMVMILIWGIMIRFIFTMNTIASVIWTIIIIFLILVIFFDNSIDKTLDIDSNNTLIMAVLIFLTLIGFIVYITCPKVLESYNTTQNRTFIQKEYSLIDETYEIYDTSLRDKSKFLLSGLSRNNSSLFAKYIVKNMKKDLNVELTMYDASTYTYKIMYEDGSIQKFEISDLKSDDEFKNNFCLNMFLDEKEEAKTKMLKEKELENKRDKLKNS